MKQLFKGLLSACVTLLLCCCFFCCTAHADGNYDLQAKHDDLNSKGNPYGVDITYSITTVHNLRASKIMPFIMMM